MKVLDVLHSPWAIEPAKLLEIQGIYLAHARGEHADIAAIEQRLGKPLVNEPKRYDIRDGVAIIPIEGVIAKRMNLFSQISGGTSSELAGAALRDALADPAVHSIVLSVDSPGGTVDGTQALASQVMAARGRKPIVTLASGTMASAAYWIGSAADRTYIADGTTQVGSIGVVATHTDVSAAEAQRGLKTTEVVAGRYKRIASQYGPLTEEGRKSIQEQVDYTYSLFVSAVAQQRGVSVDKVLADMADGRVFIGQQAKAAGLVDDVKTLDEVIADLNAPRAPSSPLQGAQMPITRQQIEAEAPDIVAALRAEGADAERARIQAVESALIPGHEALIGALKFDGKTSGGDAAMAVNAAERALRQRAVAASQGEAPAPLPSTSVPAVEPRADAQDQEDMSLPVDKRCEARWSKDAALHREFTSLAAYTAYVRSAEKGVARIMNKQGV
jgi:signal peptide peptidase SppA